MWPLIKRDLDQMVTTTLRSSGITHAIFVIIAILLMWVLGPRQFHLLDKRTINGFILLIGMIVAGLLYTQFSLEQDASNRQLTFLQLLPIRKVDIVHAKYISHLLVVTAAFVWASLLISFNLWINSTWTIDGWLIAVAFISMLLFLMACSLLLYFLSGNKHRFIWTYVMAIGWTTVLFIWIGPLASGIGISFGKLSSIIFILAVITYLISWGLSVINIQKKGTPIEVENLLLDKQNERIETLKQRYKERKGKEVGE